MTEFAYGAPAEEDVEPLAYGSALPVAPQLSEPDLNARVARADFALGDKSPGAKELKDAFREGREGELRQSAAALADAEFKQEKLAQVQALVTQDKSITPEAIHGLMAAGTTPEANPKTVFEDKFAKGFVNAGVIGDPEKNRVFQSAYEEVPLETQRATLIAAGVITKNHIVKGVAEKARAEYEALPWFGEGSMRPDKDTNQQDKFSNHLKNVVSGGIASMINLHNLVNSNPTNSILPGSNQLEQIQSLFMLPHDQIEDTLMKAAGPGSEFWRTNPVDAMTFIEAATSYSASDSFVDNALGVFNVASMIPFGSLAGGLSRLTGKSAVRPIQSIETAAKIAEDVLKGSPVAPPIPGMPARQSAANTATDVLSQSSKPPTPGYYVPEAAIGSMQTANKAKTASFVPDFTAAVGKDGVPIIQDRTGAFVDLKRTPEAEHYPVIVNPQSEKTTFRTKDAVYEVKPEGTVREGQEAPAKTIYVDRAGADKLIKLKEEGKNYDLLQDDKGNWFVGDRDNIRPGKMVPGTKTKASDTPERGLYPIQITEDGVHFSGSKISSVEKNIDQQVTLGPKIATEAEYQAKAALADIAKAQNETHVVDALSKMGQHEEAAKIQAAQALETRLNLTAPKADPEDIRRAIPSSASPQPFYHNSASLTRERASRLADEALQRDVRLGAVVTNPQRVERLTREALSAAIDEASRWVKTRYNRASNSILDTVNGWDSASNTYFIETRFGKRDGTLFDTKVQANTVGKMDYRLGSSFTVQQEGNKFYLSHIKHLTETDDVVRNHLIVAENKTPQGWWNSLINRASGLVFKDGSIRSSRYTTSNFQSSQRVTATHAPSIMRNEIEEVAKEIQKMGNWTTGERHELQRILEHNRDYMHPNGDRGLFYTSALEFETAFNNMFGRFPTEKQIVAYENFTRLSDLDATLRMLDLYRDKARLGIRNYQVAYTKTDDAGIPQKGKTDWFHGKEVENFDPVNTQNANIFVMPEGRFTTKHGLKKETVEDLLTQKKIKEGQYKIIQVENPGGKPLKDATGIKDNIHFVVVDKFDEKAIKLGEGFEYRPGGHVMYQDDNFMKQPQIGTGTLGRKTHFGDTTVKSFQSSVEGQMWVDRYNTARILLHEGKEAELKAYIDAGNLPETLPEFKKLFTGGGADLNTEHPFVLTAGSRDTFQSSLELQAAHPDLKDTFSSYDLTQTQGHAYLAERNQQLNSIANVGTQANPIYNNVPSRLYDPYTALQKGMAQIVRERWMGDYKIQAAESWVQEFGLLFDQSKLPLSKLRQNPIYWLYHAEGNLDMGLAKTQPEMLAAALTSRRNIITFMGARDELGGIVAGLERKVIQKLDTIGGAKLAMQAEERILPAIKSVPGYARAATFHAVIGLHNPVQVFQQAHGLTHILALSPQHGFKATTASALVRRYRYTEDPAILSSMGDHAAGLNGKLDQTFGTGWTKEHFMEAYGAWKNSGTHNIGGETSLLSEIQDPKIFTGPAGRFLDKGTLFFKTGESIVRDTAYFAAYSEWRAANPLAKLDNKAMGDIGNRFDTLSMNMTRASNAGYNEGMWSIPAQFWTWNARFAEQMIGKQLTGWETARAFTMYSAMYGVPATLGGISMGLPNPVSYLTGLPNTNYQDIREYALKNNINVSDKWYQAFSEGLPAMIMNGITGHDTDFQRFGPNATQIKEILDGKKSAYEVFGGASGAFMVNAFHAIAPAMNYVMSAFKSDSHFPLKMNDFKTVFELASGFSNGERMYIGLTLGKNIMKKEGIVDNEIDTFEAMMLGLGLQPKRDSDAYTKLNVMKEREAVQKKLSKQIQEDTIIGLRAGIRGDMATMADYMTRVKTYIQAGDFTKRQEIDEFKKATKGANQDLVSGVERQWRQKMNEFQSIPKMKQYLDNLQKVR